MIKARFMTYRDRREPSNPFRWETVRLNLPGSAEYNPAVPWVFKVMNNSLVACKIYIYVNDGQLMGPTKLEAWLAACRFCSTTLVHLCVQEAPRERYKPLTKPGPWAGTVTRTSNRAVLATVMVEKWLKSQ